MSLGRRHLLERELASIKGKIDEHDVPLANLRARRDELILELRALPDPPSTRAVAEIAGVSPAWPSTLERRAKT